ncbi:Ribonuclease R [Caulifigura coniformis]|uniref:Ribonuclease R n=1 Tax=Caulifigura coniformis TaxID=2527983 RepID=A0A517SN05_9PLAN|nr:ribonuclease R [Caulifigura coniformis]QDT57502.1 Ribonuclease R [Caulifigura coniformis]
MPLPIEQLLRDYISRPGYKPEKAKPLAKALGIKKQRFEEFKEKVDQLVAAGTLGRTESGKIIAGKGLLKGAASSGRQIVGTLKRTAAGDGFVLPQGANREHHNVEIFIDSSQMRDAQTGDTVLVEFMAERMGGGRRMGRIVEVVERASTTFVGVYYEDDGQAWVMIDGKQFADPVWLGDPGAKGAQPEDKVVIDMVRFPTPHRHGEAVITQVLGARGEPGVDLLTIIHEFGLPTEFPEAVLAEAREKALTIDEEVFVDREDLTNETIITIDPVDARDFDDAISLHRTDDGHWHLGVHIADVSYFVTPGSPLDVEAKRRGNSVYLPRHVIPMLPEVISNSLASLQADHVRYTLSAFIEYSPEGIPVHTRFARTAIKVKQRFAYEQVMPIINNPKKATDVSDEVLKLLLDMFELAMILRKRRFAKGALELSMGDIELEIDKEGRVTGAHEEHDDESHQIIEEFMLAANVAVATFLDDRGDEFVRRVHADPSEMKMKAFGEFAASVGHPVKQVQSRKELQALLEKVRPLPEGRAVNYALLRSLKQAVYSPEVAGHYALAEDQYAHFTSPIRRYPDLLIHRQLIGRITGTRTYSVPRGAELAQVAQHCSDTERRAEQAERELKKIKLLEYLYERISEEFDATVTGVDRYGFFCRGNTMPAEGLVHITTLRDDIYDYDRAGHCLTGRRSGRTIRLGDPVRVAVARVDIDRRELDLRLVEGPGPSTRRSSGPKKSGSKPGRPRPSKGSNSGPPREKGRARKRRGH